MAPNSNPPTAWTIAGSDSGGGAGIQVDLKVMNAFGVHGCSITTALTAQNTLGVQATEPVSETLLRAQFQALEKDLPPAALKTGMLGNAVTCQTVAEFLQTIKAPVVCDPVLKSTSGTDLLDPEALEILIQQIFPRVDLLTPNLPEVEKMIGSFQSVEEAAERILALGVKSVLIKGGHAKGSMCRDYWTNGTQSMGLSSPRIDTQSTHGTGCILASAIASAIALGQEIPEAIITAKTFLNQCLKSPTHLGAGHGPMMIQPFANRSEDQPNLVAGVADPGLRNPGSPIPATTIH